MGSQEEEQGPVLDLSVVSSELLWMSQVGHLRQQHPHVTTIHLALPSTIPAAVAADGIRLLYNFSCLHSLRLGFAGPRARISEPIIAAAAELLPLRRLEVAQGRLSSRADLSRWSSLARLEDLQLLLGAGGGIGDRQLASLRHMTGLTQLQLRGHSRKLTSAGLQQLTSFQGLRTLGLVPAGRRLTEEMLQQLLGLPQLQLLRLGMQHSRQVLQFTGLSFPPRVQLQLAVLDPRRLAPAEVLSVLSWCLPHTLVSLRLGTVRSAAPGDVLVLLGTLTGLQALSLQVTAIPNKHMSGTMELTALSCLTRLTSVEVVVSERVYLPLTPRSVALLSTAWPRLAHLVLSAAGKREVSAAALYQLHCFTALRSLHLHYPLPEDCEPDEEQQAAAKAAAGADAGSAGWWEWIRGSLLGQAAPVEAAGKDGGGAAGSEDEGAGGAPNWQDETEDEEAFTSDSSSSGSEDEGMGEGFRAFMGRRQQRMASEAELEAVGRGRMGVRLQVGGRSRSSSSTGNPHAQSGAVRPLGRFSHQGSQGSNSSSNILASAGSGGLTGATRWGSGPVGGWGGAPGSPLVGPLSPHKRQQQLVQQQLAGSGHQRHMAAPGAQERMSAASGTAAGSHIGSPMHRDQAAAAAADTNNSSWSTSVLGAFCVAPAQLRLLTGGLNAATAPTGQSLTSAGSTPNPSQPRSSWFGNSSSSSGGVQRSASLGGVAAATGAAGHPVSPGGAAGSRSSSFDLPIGQLEGPQPLVLSLLPASLERLSVQGYELLLDAPPAQQRSRLQGTSNVGDAGCNGAAAGAGASAGARAGASAVAGGANGTSSRASVPNASGGSPDPSGLPSNGTTATTNSSSSSSSSSTASRGSQAPVASRLQELQLEECGASDTLMLRLLAQATSLRRLELKGVSGLTDGGLASLPALSALTHLQLEADEASDISLAGMWAVSQLPELRHLSWSCHDELPPLVTQPPTPGLPSGQVLTAAAAASGSFLSPISSAGSNQGLRAGGSQLQQGLGGSAPLLQHLAALQQLRQLHLVAEEPSLAAAAEAAAVAGAIARSSYSSGRAGGGTAAAAGSSSDAGDGHRSSSSSATKAAQQTSSAASRSAPGSPSLGTPAAAAGDGSDAEAEEVVIADPAPTRLEMQSAWQEALARVLPMCEVVVDFTDQLVLDEPQDVWGDLQE